MTENTTTETRTETNSRMKAVDHTHPDTGRPFGDRVVYQRGPVVAADGGEREPRRSAERSDGGARPSEDDPEADAEGVEQSEDTDETRMRDVDHEPPNEAEANRVFERGNEGRDETR